MRRLMLLRHAKSDWPAGMPDLDRPLAQRGMEAAPRMGCYMAEEGLLPDLALVSPARRTDQTWDLVAPALGMVEVRVENRIYEASPERLLEVIREVGDGVRGLLLVGHNPGTQDLAAHLVGHGDRYAFARMSQKYPTAGLAVIDFPAETWAEVDFRGGRLDRFVTPKVIGAGEDEL
ncbi:SixA phosphatase family protein [Salinarimonas soli]|uniref:Histidine phosphatase family protein n=1 Tax=Salinarimonas soli TaxID=1638099 RepID=A0A5B2W132_9HYPH|nr:histidine phosphatase family protein [Salinarimonas soli]KAA2244196.1 histidine phosphatase family protein [Salinarimonas soli]